MSITDINFIKKQPNLTSVKFIIIVLLFPHIGYSQKNDLSEKELIGKVLTLNETTKYYDDDGIIKDENKYIYTFNSYGFIVKQNYFYNGTLENTDSYSYDGSKIIRRNSQDKHGNTDEELFSYPKNSKRISIKKTSIYNSITNLDTFEYLDSLDSKGNLVIHNLFWRNGNYKDVYLRNTDGAVIEAKTYKEGILENLSLYSYDLQGRRVKFNHYNRGGSFHYSETTYAYVQNGIEVDYRNFDFTTWSEYYKYIYEYDSKGNWVKRYKHDLNNQSKLTEITTRFIEYY